MRQLPTIKDFKVGEFYPILLINNKARGRTEEECIVLAEVVSVGRKLITCQGYKGFYGLEKFTVEDVNRYGGLPMKTNYTPDLVLFKNIEDIEETKKCKEILKAIQREISYLRAEQCTVKELNKIKDLLGI